MAVNRSGPATRLMCVDVETIPDRARLPVDWGSKFPKPLHHRVVCVSFVEAEISIDGDLCERYAVTACRSGGEAGWDERRLLGAFWAYFARRPTRLVTWNGRSFDMPVLLQRTMVNGLTARGYFTSGSRFDGYAYRYGDRHCDLMDMLADYGACAKLSLDETAAAIGLPGKIGGHGSEVEAMMQAGEEEQVRRYCEGDVLNLFGLYVRHGLLTGRMTEAGYRAALGGLADFLDAERGSRPHLGEFLDLWSRSEDLAVVRRSLARPACGMENAGILST